LAEDLRNQTRAQAVGNHHRDTEGTEKFLCALCVSVVFF
jgi:hypothetical protein